MLLGCAAGPHTHGDGSMDAVIFALCVGCDVRDICVCVCVCVTDVTWPWVATQPTASWLHKHVIDVRGVLVGVGGPGERTVISTDSDVILIVRSLYI